MSHLGLLVTSGQQINSVTHHCVSSNCSDSCIGRMCGSSMRSGRHTSPRRPMGSCLCWRWMARCWQSQQPSVSVLATTRPSMQRLCGVCHPDHHICMFVLLYLDKQHTVLLMICMLLDMIACTCICPVSAWIRCMMDPAPQPVNCSLYDQLPCMLCHAARYCATLAGLLPSDDFQAALCDELYEIVQETLAVRTELSRS